MPAGRPPMWDDSEAFAKKVEEYFDTEKMPTWSGLALYMGFESRQSLDEYKKKPEFAYPIKKALLRIEGIYETSLRNGNAVAGSIFALKNFGWTDKQEIDQKTEHSGSIAITWEKPPIQDSSNQSSD